MKPQICVSVVCEEMQEVGVFQEGSQGHSLGTPLSADKDGNSRSFFKNLVIRLYVLSHFTMGAACGSGGRAGWLVTERLSVEVSLSKSPHPDCSRRAGMGDTAVGV